MRNKFWIGVLLSLLLGGLTYAQDYHPIEEVTVTTDPDGDLWPIANLIQGPGVGFDVEEPQDQNVGGAENLWVTNADAGFPADYIEEVEQPVIQIDLGADRTLKEISVWGYSGTNSNGTSQFSLRFATAAEGGGDGIFGTVNYGDSITYSPTFDMFVDPTPQQYKLFSEVVTARYVEFTNVDNYFVPPGNNPGPDPSEIDPRLLKGLNTGGYLPGGDRVGFGEVAFMDLPPSFQPGDKIPRSIDGDEFGSLEVGASRSGEEFGPPSDPEPGLLQGWYDGTVGSKSALDALVTAGTPMVPLFRSEETWWSGSADVSDVQKYPLEVEDVTTGDAYTAQLLGEILIPEGAGTIQFVDGVDDYAYFAIDIDQSGVAGDTADEVLIDDNAWTDALSVGNGGAPIVEADFSDLGGQWLQMEFSMSEGGGGDAGIIYWNALDTEDVFPLAQGDGVDDLDAVVLQIPISNLRSSTRELLNADADGSLADAIGQADVLELNVQVAPNGNDQVTLQDLTVGEGTATLDVSDTTVRIQASGDIAEGTEFQIFGADAVTGLGAEDGFTLLFDDESLWNTSKLSQGILIFGPVVEECDDTTGGDLDGNGKVEFADFLILSAHFNEPPPPLPADAHTVGDINCDGKVDFADFLVLSGNFGNDVGGAESVPEPSGLALLGLAALFGGFFRRRR